MKKVSSTHKPSELEISLALTEAIANIPDPQTLFQVIYETLRPVLRFAMTLIILPTEDPEYGEIYLQALSAPEALRPLSQRQAVYIRDALPGFDPYSADILRFAASELILHEMDLTSEMEILEKELGIENFTLCPLVHSGKNVGYWILGHQKRNPFKEERLPLLRQVSKIIAGAVASTIAYNKLRQSEQDAQRLLGFTTAVMNAQQTGEFFQNLARHLHTLCPFTLASLQGLDQEEDSYCWLMDGPDTMRPLAEEPIPRINQDTPSAPLAQVRRFKPLLLPTSAQELCARYQISTLVQFQMLIDSNHLTITLGGRAHQEKALSASGFLEQIVPQLYLALHNQLTWSKVQALQKRLQMENRILLDEIASPTTPTQIIGQGPAFRKTLSRARLVAGSDTTVLLLGETGTGKEVIARFLHDTSPRHTKPLVKVNCAALPAQLIESELFGHEKGAFTGAIERRLGKFELAQGGTLFLDEIGELPLESQAKLLRVLQEKEFERIGGHQTLPADVRVIAATNRDLAEEARRGTFRSDLYYRLSVFPLSLPPLRERPEDIPLLADVFLRRAAKKLGRTLRPLEPSELALLTTYSWPGNIRELEHVMENAAILAKESVPNLRDFRILSTNTPLYPTEEETLQPFEEHLREYLLKALRQCKGRIGGPQGAATLLGLHEKTLSSKMRKLGIKRKVDFGL